MIKSNPGKNNYVTAAPFYKNATEESTYRGACYYFRDYRAHERKAEYPWDWFNMMGGATQNELENYTILQCEEKYKRACVVLLYNNIERCDATFKNSYLRLMEKSSQEKLAQERSKQEGERKKIEKIRETCESFGFPKGSNQLSACVLEMYKSLEHIEAIRSSAQMQADAAAANTAELQKIREFEQGMLLLQSSSNILNPINQNKPRFDCRYNAIMKTISCN